MWSTKEVSSGQSQNILPKTYNKFDFTSVIQQKEL